MMKEYMEMKMLVPGRLKVIIDQDANLALLGSVFSCTIKQDNPEYPLYYLKDPIVQTCHVARQIVKPRKIRNHMRLLGFKLQYSFQIVVLAPKPIIHYFLMCMEYLASGKCEVKSRCTLPQQGIQRYCMYRRHFKFMSNLHGSLIVSMISSTTKDTRYLDKIYFLLQKRV